VNLTASSLLTGATTQATAVARDANNNVLTGRTVSWTSSNTGVATVTSSGLVTARAAGTTQITATVEGRSGSRALSVTAPVVTPPPSTGGLAPDANDRILLDVRQSLQQATSVSQALGLFPGNDHTPVRGARNSAGWSFAQNFDGRGTKALRADWGAVSGDQGVRIITNLTGTKPRELYIQFKGRLGKHPSDADANGSDNVFPLYPQSNSMKRLLINRDGVGGGGQSRIDYVWTRTNPSVARVQIDHLNWGVDGSASTWTASKIVGREYTTTIYVKVSSSNGARDGIYRVWVDGVQVLNQTGVNLDGYALDRFEFPSVAHSFPVPASEYYWDFLAWSPVP